MPTWTQTERRFMALALDLAGRGQGLVEPNPMVGCVIASGSRIVGSGFHRKFGGPHAEPIALRAAADLAEGATVYVTLEPCNHTGKTPPCTEALIRAGVKRVIAAMKDPNPLVAGKGFRRLRAAGIQVQVGLMRDAAMALNAPFIKYFLEHRPYVILKWAQSIDGKIATRTGDSKWISSIESRKAAHALRARVDGIIVGIDTVLADDPDLTARLVRPKRTAARIILDPSLRIPLDSQIVRTAKMVPTIIAAGLLVRNRPSLAARRKLARLERAGCEILNPLLQHYLAGPSSIPRSLVLPGSTQTAIRNPRSAIARRSPATTSRLGDLAPFAVASQRRSTSGIDLDTLLAALRDRQMTNLLVEGGGRVLGSFLEQGLADEATIFVAPKLIGGEEAPGPLRSLGPGRMTDLPRIARCLVTHLGQDICYNVRFR